MQKDQRIQKKDVKRDWCARFESERKLHIKMLESDKNSQTS